MENKENIFETIPKHYYPYYIQLYNLFSFEYLNKLITPSILALFSISRMRGSGKHRRNIKYTAMYNIYYQYYLFDDKRFVSYDELLNYIYYFN
jgi:hypothetical protein